jgi:hypothetical protein
LFFFKSRVHNRRQGLRCCCCWWWEAALNVSSQIRPLSLCFALLCKQQSCVGPLMGPTQNQKVGRYVASCPRRPPPPPLLWQVQTSVGWFLLVGQFQFWGWLPSTYPDCRY